MKVKCYFTELEVKEIYRGDSTSVIKCKILKHPLPNIDYDELHSVELPNSEVNRIKVNDIFRTTLLSTSTIEEMADSGEMNVLNAKVEIWNRENNAWDLLSEM